MSKRDEKLAAKHAAKGKESASARNARKAEEKASRVPAKSGESVMDGMRRALGEPRTEESRAAAQAYKRNLPRLGRTQG
jgi:hypothetical protein